MTALQSHSSNVWPWANGLCAIIEREPDSGLWPHESPPSSEKQSKLRWKATRPDLVRQMVLIPVPNLLTQWIWRYSLAYSNRRTDPAKWHWAPALEIRIGIEIRIQSNCVSCDLLCLQTNKAKKRNANLTTLCWLNCVSLILPSANSHAPTYLTTMLSCLLGIFFRSLMVFWCILN